MQQVTVRPSADSSLYPLHQVSLAVRPGQILAVVGGPDSGLGTLAHLLTGPLPEGTKVRGRVRVAGVDPQSPNVVIDQHAAYVGPQPVLNPRQSLGRQLSDALLHARFDRRDIDRRAGALLRAVGLGAEYGTSPAKLSVLERHRADLALALATGAKVLVSDRYGEESDVYVRGEVRTLLREAREYLNLAILFLSQDMGAVADIADKVSVLHEGRLTEPMPARAFFSSPPGERARKLIAAAPRLTISENSSGRAAVAKALRRVRAEEAHSAQRAMDERARLRAIFRETEIGGGADLADTTEDDVAYAVYGTEQRVIDLDEMDDGSHGARPRRSTAAGGTDGVVDDGEVIVDGEVVDAPDAPDSPEGVVVTEVSTDLQTTAQELPVADAAALPAGGAPGLPSRADRRAAELAQHPGAQVAERPGGFLARLFGRRVAEPTEAMGTEDVGTAVALGGQEIDPAHLTLPASDAPQLPAGTYAMGATGTDLVTGEDLHFTADADLAVYDEEELGDLEDLSLGDEDAGLVDLEPGLFASTGHYDPEGVDLADSPPLPRHEDEVQEPESIVAPVQVVDLRVNRKDHWYATGRTCLQDVQLTVKPGETVGVLGTSGSGTTALLEAIHGWVHPSHGRVLVFGERVGRTPHTQTTVPGRTAYLAADPHLGEDPDQSVKDHLEAAIRPVLTAVDETDLHMRTLGLMDEVDLPRSVATEPIGTLSPLHRRLLALAAALAGSPKVLLLDEPTLLLDPVTAKAWLGKLSALQDRRRLTMLVSSHDPATVVAVADRAIVLHRGRVVESGIVPGVLTDPSDPVTERLVLSVPAPNPLVQARRRAQRAPRIAETLAAAGH